VEKKIAAFKTVFLIASATALASTQAHAIELDWSGQFRAELNLLKNYTMDSSDAGGNTDPTRAAADGYYVPGSGQNSANFQTLFMRLKPRLVVNDNVYVKSEWWLGDPVFGFFGNAVPHNASERQVYSNQSRGAQLTAQRFWVDVVTDFGTLQVGRAPLNWGLGLVWNAGDGIWDRYQSTGDTVRLVAKLGTFSLIPSFVSYSFGNTLGGNCVQGVSGGTVTCTPGAGSGGVTEYTLALQYDNPDEDFEAGVNFVRRLTGAGQDVTAGYQGFNGTASSTAFNIWDIYTRKKLGSLTLSAEAPITSGKLGLVDYSTLALAAEADWEISDSWSLLTRAGRAPGQPNLADGATPSEYKIFYFHPNYNIGTILFNYQLANLAGVNATNNPAFGEQDLRSLYDNPIANANYVGVNGAYRTDKWTFNAGLIYAAAAESATAGQKFFNVWDRKFSDTVAVRDQSKSLGVEVDTSADFQWDDNFQFGVGLAFFFPGAFYSFSNTAVDNATNTVWQTQARLGVNF